jgi:uncharacterized protein YehS (DUF1456 family)
MTNNDKLRRIRYALDISDREVVNLFAMAGYDLTPIELQALFKKEEDPGFDECPDDIAFLFLQGLIASRRGKRDDAPAKSEPAAKRVLSNNDILKSLRIALQLKDEDIIEIMRLAKVDVSKSEVNALFRNRGHSNFRPCGDQFLRHFLAGLTAKYRKLSAD